MTARGNASRDYESSRTIILLLGLIVLTIIGGIMWVRGVEPIEVSATVFFIPVFAAIVFFGLRGGLAIGALAAAAYALIRIPSIQTVGFGPLAGLLVSRVAGYLVFGAVGGWAVDSLRHSIEKLARVDRTDDETLLNNAVAFIEQVGHERARADRYESEFSAVVVNFAADDLDRRSRSDLMKGLGSHLAANVRTVDEISHARLNGADYFGFVLPETGQAGAAVFTDKLTNTLATIVPGDRAFETKVATYPSAADELDDLIETFHEVSRQEHPTAS